MAFAPPTVPQKEQLWAWTTQGSSWHGSFNSHKLWAYICGCVNITRHNHNAKSLQTRNYVYCFVCFSPNTPTNTIKAFVPVITIQIQLFQTLFSINNINWGLFPVAKTLNSIDLNSELTNDCSDHPFNPFLYDISFTPSLSWNDCILLNHASRINSVLSLPSPNGVSHTE